MRLKISKRCTCGTNNNKHKSYCALWEYRGVGKDKKPPVKKRKQWIRGWLKRNK